MGLMAGQGIVTFELRIIKSKHCGKNTNASLQRQRLFLALASSPRFHPLFFPHQTPASTDDALKRSLCALHTKQSEAALKKQAAERKSGEVSNALLSMHI